MGYHFVVNLEVVSSNKTTVKEWRDDRWLTVANANYRLNGNGMEISIARSTLRQAGKIPAFDFHWADNIQKLDDISEFGVNGDSAPNRRWNYRFEADL
jgi:hypothetical protein